MKLSILILLTPWLASCVVDDEDDRTCRVVIDATIDGQRTQPVTIDVYSSPW